MRVVLRAENTFKKRHGKYAESLEALAGTGSFTKRMAHSTDRGDYKVSFRPKHAGPNHDGFVLTMTPKQMDGDHRSFYAEEDGVIHADDQKPADEGLAKSAVKLLASCLRSFLENRWHECASSLATLFRRGRGSPDRRLDVFREGRAGSDWTVGI